MTLYAKLSPTCVSWITQYDARVTLNVTLEDTWIFPSSFWPYLVSFLSSFNTRTHNIWNAYNLMMCPSYSLTSQRTQTLLNSGRKLDLCCNVWHTAVDRPPRSPCPSKLMDTNVSPHENVSWNRKKWKHWNIEKWQEEMEQKWPTNISKML